MHHQKNYIAISLLALACVLILAVNSFAGEKIGTVVNLSGPLFAKKTDGTTRVLTRNSTVEDGDTLVTEKGTYGRIKFTDNSEITLRPNTQIKISHYSFNAAKPKEDSAVFDMAKGGLRAVTGLVGKRGDPDSYKVNTAVGTIGIRGTTYEATLCINNCGTLSPGLYVAVLNGAIHVTNGGGSQNFSAGQFGFTPNFKQPPVILPKNPGIQFTPPPSFSSTSSQGSKQGGGKPGNVDCQVR
ncbi:MAG: FecR domain-containing protein [Dissulfurispiraceae bacterium]|jgi:hypothetical protein